MLRKLLRHTKSFAPIGQLNWPKLCILLYRVYRTRMLHFREHGQRGALLSYRGKICKHPMDSIIVACRGVCNVERSNDFRLR